MKTRRATKKETQKDNKKASKSEDVKNKKPQKKSIPQKPKNRKYKKPQQSSSQSSPPPKPTKGKRGRKPLSQAQKSSSPQPVNKKKDQNKKSKSPISKQKSPQPLKSKKGGKGKQKVKKVESSSQSSSSPSPAKKIKISKSKDSKKSKQSKQSDKKQPVKKQPVKKTQSKDMKKVIVKGSVPVDHHFTIPNTRVLTFNGITYAATLNLSNISNNNNKFYICQVLQSQINPNNFYFFTRWGRVGVTGQMSSVGPTSRDSVIHQYNCKIKDKTKSGQYRIVQMNYENNDDDKNSQDQKDKKKNETPQIQSTLKVEVQNLIRLIFDMKMMNNQMKEIGYDAKKMPLGKLAKSSIMKGYQALKGLMDQVKGKKRKQILQKFTNDFYSYIPHDFGFMKMHNFLLDNEKKVKEKLEMLQSLQDIQVFTKLLDQGKIDSDMNQLDSNYLKLNTQIEPLPKNSTIYKMLLQYVKNTHAKTHSSFQLQVQEIFALKKQTEEARYTKDLGNKQLLWHGSRLTNFVGILSQGLRIAPPQAPVTGYMFGKGVYFADMVSKSANYCFTNRTNNTGLMLLCEVALGQINQKKHSDYYANLLPPGKSSTKGLGKTAPLSGKTIQNDIYVPMGVGQQTGILDTSLLYNEFIVYDVSQIKCRYLLKMKFNYSY